MSTQSVSRPHPAGVYLRKRLPLPSSIPHTLDYRLAELNSTILDSVPNYFLAMAASSPMKLSTLTKLRQHFEQHLAITTVAQNHPLP